MEECEPVYETLPGWQQPLTEARTADDIPQTTKDYVTYVADFPQCANTDYLSRSRQRSDCALGDPVW